MLQISWRWTIGRRRMGRVARYKVGLDPGEEEIAALAVNDALQAEGLRVGREVHLVLAMYRERNWYDERAARVLRERGLSFQPKTSSRSRSPDAGHGSSLSSSAKQKAHVRLIS